MSCDSKIATMCIAFFYMYAADYYINVSLSVSLSLHPVMLVFSPCGCLGKDPEGPAIYCYLHTGALVVHRDPGWHVTLQK